MFRRFLPKLSQRYISVLAVISFSLIPASQISAANVVLRVGDVYAIPGETSVHVPVYLENYIDTVNSLRLWVQIGLPEFGTFASSFDSTGSLMSGWDYASVRSIFGTQFDGMIEGVADFPSAPIENALTAPQTGPKPLISLLFDVSQLSDTVSNRKEAIVINTFRDYFELANHRAEVIGYRDTTLIDTTYYRCESWLPPDSTTCLSWAVVPFLPADSIVIDTTYTSVIDSGYFEILDGSITILRPVCGDIDGSMDEIVDVSDLTAMIKYLFLDGKLLHTALGNIDGSADQVVDVGDLTALIGYLFISGNGLACLL